MDERMSASALPMKAPMNCQAGVLPWDTAKTRNASWTAGESDPVWHNGSLRRSRIRQPPVAARPDTDSFTIDSKAAATGADRLSRFTYR
jgi:hypothetical protein